jgi:MFS family permease
VGKPRMSMFATMAYRYAVVKQPDKHGPILALATGMFVFYGLLSLPQGWLAERFGHKIQMTAFFLGVAVGLIGAGLSHSPTMLAIAL